MNSPDTNVVAPAIPHDGIRYLSHLWAGAGGLHEWLVPTEWDISRVWSSETVKARFAESVLWEAERSIASRLPSGVAAWLDQFEAQVIRNTAYTDLPTAHTDWALTLSQFGRYPSPQYVDRKPLNTLESALSRVSLWIGQAVENAERLVMAKFGRVAISDQARARLLAPAKVAKILALTAPDKLFDEDVSICVSAGGNWALLARLARQLSGIWKRDANSQLAALPSVLPELGAQLFELATLGECILSIRTSHSGGAWKSLAPIGAAEKQAACVVFEKEGFRCEAFYQIVPTDRRCSTGPYETLGAVLNVGALRPDVWLKFEIGSSKTELVIESKYSLDASYISSGITQILGYSIEHPVPVGWRRFYMVVGPKEVVSGMSEWDGRFFIGNLSHVRELVGKIISNSI